MEIAPCYGDRAERKGHSIVVIMLDIDHFG